MTDRRRVSCSGGPLDGRSITVGPKTVRVEVPIITQGQETLDLLALRDAGYEVEIPEDAVEPLWDIGNYKPDDTDPLRWRWHPPLASQERTR